MYVISGEGLSKPLAFGGGGEPEYPVGGRAVLFSVPVYFCPTSPLK